MKHVKLIRYNDTGSCTLGLMYVESIFECYTLERPWINNKPFISCIPTGLYIVNWKDDKERYRLYDVHGRTGIDIHVGNTVDDTTGCILLGEEVSYNHDTYLAFSSNAVKHFNNLMAKKPFILEIKDIRI